MPLDTYWWLFYGRFCKNLKVLRLKIVNIICYIISRFNYIFEFSFLHFSTIGTYLLLLIIFNNSIKPIFVNIHPQYKGYTWSRIYIENPILMQYLTIRFGTALESNSILLVWKTLLPNMNFKTLLLPKAQDKIKKYFRYYFL